MPFMVQLLLLGIAGACVAGQLNRAIYRWAIFFPRSISPWTPPPTNTPPRTLTDCIPIWGWWKMRREEQLHGTGFWIRPMLLECLVAVGFPLQYWWEMQGGLIPLSFPVPEPAVLQASCAIHLLLFCFMLIGSVIDMDEKTIPDEVTVYGTIAGLSLAILFPRVLLPHPIPGPTPEVVPLWLSNPWPTWLDGTKGLAVGLACFLGWVYAILPKLWRTKSGFVMAFRILSASLWRYAVNRTVGIGLTMGCLTIILVWWQGGLRWQALLTSLAGLAFGGGLVWSVRIVGALSLRREAMGFGDVTLMAMIGSFVGWQPCVIIFFIAPICGVFLAVGQWVTTGRKDIAYGPFLCFATWLVVELWCEFWHHGVGDVFHVLGSFISWVLLVCMLMMYFMLTCWRLITRQQ